MRNSPQPSLLAIRREWSNQRREQRPLYIAILFSCVFVALAFIFHAPPSSPKINDNFSPVQRQPIKLLTSVRASGYPKGFCTVETSGTETFGPKNFLGSSHRAWLALLLPAVVFLFIGLAIVTDDFFVPSLEAICNRLNLDEDVAGATFMAAGSSAPELFTSLLGTLLFKDDIGVGTIVGSAVFNILIIIGLSGALSDKPLDLDFRPLLRDSSFYILSIILLILFVMFIGGHRNPDTGVYETAGQINWWEGLIFVIVYVLYILFMKYGNKPYFKWAERFRKERNVTSIGADPENVPVERTDNLTSVSASIRESQVPLSPPSASDRNLQHRRSTYYQRNPRSLFRVLSLAIMAANSLQQNSDDENGNHPLEHTYSNGESLNRAASAGISGASSMNEDTICFGVMKRPTGPLGWLLVPVFLPWKLAFKVSMVTPTNTPTRNNEKWWPVTFTVSIVWIMAISYAMVEATRLSGCFIGIPSAVMGLTLLAAGTSVPDALASVSVARSGFGDMAVSNAIGSNVFDILLGLGIPWFFAGLVLPEKISTITVKPLGLVVIPIAILFAVIVALIAILILMKWKLSRPLGYILFFLYLVFVAYSLVDVYVINREFHNP